MDGKFRKEDSDLSIDHIFIDEVGTKNPEFLIRIRTSFILITSLGDRLTPILF